MLEFQTNSVTETQKIGEKLGQLLKPGNVVRLEGDLGAGKTTIAQGICRGLGVKEPVTSPTFAIMHQYNGKYPIYHIDAYRIESETELQDLGLEEFLEGEGISLVEWAEKIMPVLPTTYLLIEIRTIAANEQGRMITFQAVGNKQVYDSLLKEMAEQCEFLV